MSFFLVCATDSAHTSTMPQINIGNGYKYHQLAWGLLMPLNRREHAILPYAWISVFTFFFLSILALCVPVMTKTIETAHITIEWRTKKNDAKQKTTKRTQTYCGTSKKIKAMDTTNQSGCNTFIEIYHACVLLIININTYLNHTRWSTDALDSIQFGLALFMID